MPSVKIFRLGPAIVAGLAALATPTMAQQPTPPLSVKQLKPDVYWTQGGAGSNTGITTVKGILAVDADQFVPGHGDLQTKADIQTVLKATEGKRAKIASMVKEGKSLDEIRAATGDVPRPTAAGGRGPAFASFTDVVYQEITKKRG